MSAGAREFFDCFDSIRIINLSDRRDRKHGTVRAFRRLGLDLDQIGASFFDAIRPAEARPFELAGSRGAYESTLSLLRWARDSNLSSILILQDDVEFVRDFDVLAPVIVEDLDRRPDWQLVQFGYLQSEGHPLPKAEAGADPQLIAWEGAVIGAHFFAINGSAFDRYIAYLEDLLTRPLNDQRGGPMPIDGTMNDYPRLVAGGQRLLSLPLLGYQRSSRSDVTPRAWDRVGTLRRPLTATRALKRAVRRLR